MARYRGPVLKRCEKVGLTPQMLGVDKESIRRKDRRQKKLSEYGIQLKEKQKAKFFYGLQEKQFRAFFNRASKMKGQAGENLLKLLELRMDNVVYRLGFSSTRREARQMVVHGHFKLNGYKHDIPSAVLSVGDVIEVKEKSKKHPRIVDNIEARSLGVPEWLELDSENKKGKIIAEPRREDLDLPIEERFIVEHYSR